MYRVDVRLYIGHSGVSFLLVLVALVQDYFPSRLDCVHGSTPPRLDCVHDYSLPSRLDCLYHFCIICVSIVYRRSCCFVHVIIVNATYTAFSAASCSLVRFQTQAGI